jgi:hypothetical protein
LAKPGLRQIVSKNARRCAGESSKAFLPAFLCRKPLIEASSSALMVA